MSIIPIFVSPHEKKRQECEISMLLQGGSGSDTDGLGLRQIVLMKPVKRLSVCMVTA